MISLTREKKISSFFASQVSLSRLPRLDPLTQGALSPCLGLENQQGFYWSQMVDGVSDSEVRRGKYNHV